MTSGIARKMLNSNSHMAFTRIRTQILGGALGIQKKFVMTNYYLQNFSKLLQFAHVNSLFNSHFSLHLGFADKSLVSFPQSLITPERLISQWL